MSGFEKVPDELKRQPVWLCWKSIPNDNPEKKPRKLPVYANGRPRGAGIALDSPADRAQLVLFDEAVKEYERQPGLYAGLGIALGAIPGTDVTLSGIDLDDIAADDARVVQVIAKANSYTEISPSGNGLKIFGVGALENVKQDKNHFEIYGAGRFFTVTGRALNGAHLADLREAAQLTQRLFMPAAAPEKPAQSQQSTGKYVDQGRHNYLIKIAAQYRFKGLDGDELLAVMRVHNDKYCSPPKPDKELSEIVDWAAKQATSPKPFELLGPEAAIASYDELHAAPFQPPEIVSKYQPDEDAGAKVGPGGQGKSTLALLEAVHIRLGRPLYGREILREGPSLILTAEDQRPVVFSRINQICSALRLTTAEREHVRNGLFVEDVTTNLARLAQADPRSGVVVPGLLLDATIDKYKDSRLAGVIVDPTSLLGPGETSGNDGGSQFLRICRYMARELRASVQLIHHVSQAVARGGIMDQYAARGGTAFVDNSRFQHQLVIVDARKFVIPTWGTFNVPKIATDNDIDKGRVLAILVHKLSYQERDRVPIFLLRKGFEFVSLGIDADGGSMSFEESDAVAAKDARRLWEFVSHKFRQDAGLKLTATMIEKTYIGDLGLTQAAYRKALVEANRIGALVDTPLPKDEIRGQKKSYLHPADEYPM